MAEKRCARCAEPFQAQRSTAKFCSTSCRVRAHESPGSVVPIAQAAVASVGPLEAATVAELERADRLNTYLGQAAVVLARRVEGPGETGAALAALAKQLQATMSEATRGAGKTSAVGTLKDELAARRQRQGA